MKRLTHVAVILAAAAAVAAAKESVLRADGDLIPDLLRESGAFNRLLANPESQVAMRNFLARGGQTIEGEARKETPKA